MQDAVLDLEVIHDPVVADAKAVEGVGDSLDRPYSLSSDPPRCCRRSGEPLETSLNPCLDRTRQLPVSARRRGGEEYRVGVAQASPRRGRERPLR